MITAVIENNFRSWRESARRLLATGASPEDIQWISDGAPELFRNTEIGVFNNTSFRVPRDFVEAAELASCFDDNGKWALLYRVLFRLKNENRHLLNIESDTDVRQLRTMAKAVRRDIHKFHAFVRFREVEHEDETISIAWHEPHHFTVERAFPFFVRRFGGMRFSILTPKGCAHWDLKELKFSPPASKDLAPQGDDAEGLWLTYYRSIFNPFRLKISAMKNEMPVRHWRTMPETAMIPELIRRSMDPKR